MFRLYIRSYHQAGYGTLNNKATKKVQYCCGDEISYLHQCTNYTKIYKST